MNQQIDELIKMAKEILIREYSIEAWALRGQIRLTHKLMYGNPSDRERGWGEEMLRTDLRYLPLVTSEKPPAAGEPATPPQAGGKSRLRVVKGGGGRRGKGGAPCPRS